MLSKDNCIRAFLELVRAGLWEKEARLLQFGEVDYNEVMRLAEEQAVVGLVTAGLEHVMDVKVPKEDLLQFIGQSLQIEQQNKDMNVFLGRLIEKFRDADVYTLVIKGQGVAQCYEKPLWRACGDVDLYLSESNYEKAKEILTPIASHVENEDKTKLHIGMTIDSWVVELHGTMHEEISRRMNRGLDKVHQSIFYGGEVRSWNNNGVPVFLPSPDNDVIIVFTHFLQHFFVEGVGLRQICDWCRLLWRYRTELDLRLLESRIKRMGLMSEWKVFGVLAVNYIGIPKEAMPMLDENDNENEKLKNKAEKVLKRILKSGNFGHNNDLSYRTNYSGIKYKIVAAWRRFVEFASLVPVFPVDAPRFYVTYMKRKIRKS